MNAELKPGMKILLEKTIDFPFIHSSIIVIGIEKMVAVQEQRRQLEKWRAKFTPTVTRQLNNLFIHLVIRSSLLICRQFQFP